MQASTIVGAAAQAGAVGLALLTLLWLVNPPAGRRVVAVEALRPPAYMTGALALMFGAQVVCTCVATTVVSLSYYPHLPLLWVLDRIPWRWPESLTNATAFAAFLGYWYAIAYWRAWSVRRSQVNSSSILGPPTR